MHRSFETLLVTGGAGFMGSNFIRFLFRHAAFTGRVINVDKLTYAGDRQNLADCGAEERAGRYRLEVCDVRDREALRRLFTTERIDGVVHFAAESHVDRSIVAAQAFAGTNVLGTLSLLEAAHEVWGDRRDVLFHHISTDEVFGSCACDATFKETDPYDPSSPYAASKAGADHMVRAFGRTHGLPFTITHSCNNYGPCQTPEKLIPLVITRLATAEPIPVYGTGDNVREWIFVNDHSSAAWNVMTRGRIGESYNVGTGQRTSNLHIVHLLGGEVARQTQRDPAFYKQLITHVPDRPGHDKRYALDSTKLRSELGWHLSYTLERGLAETVAWYLGNPAWIERARQRLKNWIDVAGETGQRH